LIIFRLTIKHEIRTVIKKLKPIYAWGSFSTSRITKECIEPIILETRVIVRSQGTSNLLATIFKILKNTSARPVPKNHNAFGVRAL
jgi:hypothetical protein